MPTPKWCFFMKNFCFIVTLAFLVGCATSGRINRISLGMSKQEVVKTMGPPTSTSATHGVEYLRYLLHEIDAFDQGTPYFVRIVDGKVDAYGRVGDFDSTKIPERKLKLDVDIKDD